MNKPSIDIYRDLAERELIHQVTDTGIEKYLAQTPTTLYVGFDPTADCLHIGSLLPLLTLRRFQLAGHRPIAVVGGATGMIGDPSGKSQERSFLSLEKIEQNVDGIKKVISRYLDTEGTLGAKVINNADWFQDVSYLEFLRDVGKHFTVNHMIAKESVRSRLEDRDHGISYTEFSYMLLQAYDFYILSKKENCSLQVGGSDQWGNITAGCELIRRMHALETDKGTKPPEVYGITSPLITKSDGTKFGKTVEGAVWLDRNRTSPYRLYQFLLQTPDADVVRLLKYLTFLPIDEINALEDSLQREPEKREAQRRLAKELVHFIHSDEDFTRAEKASRALFGEEIKDLDARLSSTSLRTLPRPRSRNRTSSKLLHWLTFSCSQNFVLQKARRDATFNPGEFTSIIKDAQTPHQVLPLKT